MIEKCLVLTYLAYATIVNLASGLNNGLALTPPMGWLTWQRFRCQTDCARYPDDCISERLIQVMADRMAADGYRDVGYEYITIDDCWPALNRDSNGRLQPDPKRFSSGMKNLSDYVHSKGLKMGIYEDFGIKTCAGYPGSEFYMQLDAQTFADWGIDLLKFDGCNSNPDDAKFGYPAMAFYLNKTGRPILYFNEWPLDDKLHGRKSNYAAVQQYSNAWRNFDDVNDDWDSVKSIINYYANNDQNFLSFAGPGAWNDPDMLVIGNYGLSPDQERTQMAMWSIFAAPLIMSVDLRTIRPSSKALLQNKRLIAVNQDPMGIAGRVVYKDQNIQVWTRPILPKGSVAVVLVNLGSGGSPAQVTLPLNTIGLTYPMGYRFTETFDGGNLGQYKPADTFTCFVNPTGVFMFTANLL
ncbi:hypothetical protein CHS0354_021221 [Potamilus streckersoni]|uniref:Alpha-galactosidase n=1 Tax=Potamilus streckersoni TaxID=2493646 RepID=A0AAE0ST29_9BIVA|nr:hypothetical protein CHS0354_021221 [Potamilus streckersoni]